MGHGFSLWHLELGFGLPDIELFFLYRSGITPVGCPSILFPDLPYFLMY